MCILYIFNTNIELKYCIYGSINYQITCFSNIVYILNINVHHSDSISTTQNIHLNY